MLPEERAGSLGEERSLAPLRVALEVPDQRTIEAVLPWFAAAWQAMRGPTIRDWSEHAPDAEQWLADRTADVEHRIVAAEGAPAGIVGWRRRDRAIELQALAIKPEARNRGFGAETVYAVEALAADATIARAIMPVSNGLALYFWLRIGYSPLFARDHRLRDLTVMQRVLFVS